ncbi:MAG TPA: hypothetical protein VL328_11670 [Gemmatimonadaceae bacterium]|jgi:hypothetical protein|nr:hypothetical protein [Gemmatimonadaceae bacterium]
MSISIAARQAVILLVALVAGPFRARAQTPRSVTVYAADYAFTAPDSVPAGATTFTLVNRGPSTHHLVVFALPAGMTLARFDHLMRADSTDGSGSDGMGIIKVGGMDLAAGSDSASAVLDLAPGTYVLTCLLPLPDGSGTHRMRGMFRALTVGPSPRSQIAMPPADVVVHMTDYAFDAPATLEAGRRLVRFENAGKHPHMAIVRRLAPGKTLADEVAWATRPAGPEPSIAAGGATDLAPGRASVNLLDLEPGQYFIVCAATEGTAPKMHFQVGMFREFTVTP